MQNISWYTKQTMDATTDMQHMETLKGTLLWLNALLQR